MHFSCLFNSVLKNQIVNQCQLNFRKFEVTFEKNRKEESAIILPKLFHSDGGLTFISKFMHSARVVRIVLKDGQIHLFDSKYSVTLTLLEKFHSCAIIIVHQGETPNYRLIVISTLEYFDTFCVELFIFEFP